jgi:hypothetical protein
VKRTLFVMALVITLISLSAAAVNKPAPALSRTGNPSMKNQVHQNSKPQPPASCSPCLFYGGDLNPSDANADGFSDENTLLILGGSNTYGAVNIPAGPNANVTGILVNILATAAFDPFTATWDIRQGISEGNGGSDVTSGSGTVAVAATGRNAFGLQEYTITVTFSTVTLVPGEYWFTLEPQCLNTLDGSCTVFRQFASNTTQETNAVNGSWQPNNEMFLNSSFFAATYANWCDSTFGLNTPQCDWLSFGLVGELQ